jgi:Domain of unknown function (DUF4136)
MLRMRNLTLVLAASSLACGGGLKINTDYNQMIDFGEFETYAFMPVEDRPDDNELIAARIRNAISTNVEEGGFRKVDVAGSADLWVAWHLILDEKFSVTTTGGGYSGGYYGAYGRGYWGRYGYGGGGYGMSTSYTTVNEWTEGTLVIDLIDRENDILVYRATAESKIRENIDPQERTERINDAVARMLADFPPER